MHAVHHQANGVHPTSLVMNSTISPGSARSHLHSAFSVLQVASKTYVALADDLAVLLAADAKAAAV